MLEPPNLADDRIVAAVRRHYGLHLTTLALLPLGQDVLTWNYRAATADAATYFLKLHQGAVNQVGLRVPRYLADQGVPHIVAPLPARTRQLWGEVDGYTLTLYPFITGTTGGAHGLQEHHWVTYGAALRAIHATPLAPDLLRDVPRDTFTSRWSEVMRAVEARIAQPGLTDPIERELVAFWQERRAQIQALVARLERLGQRLRAHPHHRCSATPISTTTTS